MMDGVLEVLSVGAGDLTIAFNKEDDDEAGKAQDLIESLMRQGYAVMVRLEDGTYQRAEGFDRAHDSYVLVEKSEAGEKKRTRRPRRKTKATAVARSAGG